MVRAHLGAGAKPPPGPLRRCCRSWGTGGGDSEGEPRRLTPQGKGRAAGCGATTHDKSAQGPFRAAAVSAQPPTGATAGEAERKAACRVPHGHGPVTRDAREGMMSSSGAGAKPPLFAPRYPGLISGRGGEAAASRRASAGASPGWRSCGPFPWRARAKPARSAADPASFIPARGRSRRVPLVASSDLARWI